MCFLSLAHQPPHQPPLWTLLKAEVDKALSHTVDSYMYINLESELKCHPSLQHFSYQKLRYQSIDIIAIKVFIDLNLNCKIKRPRF